MERAIKHYIKRESEKIDGSLGRDYINQTFDRIDSEIDGVKRREIKKARRKKLREWKRLEKMNCRRNNKKKLKRRMKKGGK